MLNLLALFLVMITLNGCDYFQKPRLLEVKINSSAQLNPDLSERPSPLLVSFYELKNKIPFKNLNFTELNYGSYRYLKNNLIDFSSIEIQPGENRKYVKKIHRDCNYLGIIAAYQAIEKSRWKQIIEIPKKIQHSIIRLKLSPLKINGQLVS